MVVAETRDRADGRMKVLIDMNLSPRWQSTLAGAGIEAVHWLEVGNPGAADSEFATCALLSGLIVLMRDQDFGALLAGQFHTRCLSDGLCVA